MQRSTGRDFAVGCFVLTGLAALAYLSIQVGGVSYRGDASLTVDAAFDEIGGLKPRAPVVISGVKVGQVSSVQLGDDYRAHATLALDSKLALPVDTSASIVTAGLLGDRYVSLQLGAEEDVLRPGDEISFTESAVLLERLIGQFIHQTNVEGKEEEKE